MVSLARGADMRVAIDPIGGKLSEGLPPTFSYKTRFLLSYIVLPQPSKLKPYNLTLIGFVNRHTRFLSGITSQCTAFLSTSLFPCHLFPFSFQPIAAPVIPTITRSNPVKQTVMSLPPALRWIQIQFTACAHPNQI